MTVNKNLSLLLSGQLVSQVGDKFYLLALSFWVLTSTGSPAAMAQSQWQDSINQGARHDRRPDSGRSGCGGFGLCLCFYFQRWFLPAFGCIRNVYEIAGESGMCGKKRKSGG